MAVEKREKEEKKSMIIVVPSCLKDADGARTRLDQNSNAKPSNASLDPNSEKSPKESAVWFRCAEANIPGEATKDNAGEREVEAGKDAGRVSFKD